MPDNIHEAFIKYGMEHDTNENCIACHTSTAVSINWTRPSTLGIETGSDGYNITIKKTYSAFNEKLETFGNKEGNVFAVSNVTII